MVIAAIVADDLTGACDSAVRFVAAGWETRLLLDRRDSGLPMAGEGDALLAVTTDSRGLADDEARDATIQAVEAVQRLGATRLFLKIDSTMRGSVRGQVAGALQAWRRRWPDAVAVVCPAYPSMGRTVAAGVLLVDGVPVAESGLRDDPVTPALTSELGELLPGSVPLSRFGAGSAEALAHGSPRAGVLTADAQTDADLQELAEAIALRPTAAIPVGSAGLALAMARTWRQAAAMVAPAAIAVPIPAGGSRRVLVQVSSLNEVSRRQLAVLEAQYAGRCLRLAPDLRTLSDPRVLWDWFEHQAADDDGYDLVVVTAPVERSREREPDLSRGLAERLGSLTAGLLRSGRFGVAGLVGGDGARAALAALDVTALRILGDLEEGIPMSVAVDGEAADTLFFTKAGGFGGPDALASVVARLTATAPRRSNA